MNIWLMNHHAVNRGRHYNFARELVARGHAVTIISASFRHNDYRETRDYQGKKFLIEQDQGITWIWVKTPPYRGNGPRRIINQLVFARRAEIIGRRLDAPDVIVGSSVHLFTGLAARRLAALFRVPFIFEVRDLWPQTLIDLGVIKPWGLAARLLGALERYLYRTADGIISVLPFGHHYMVSLGVDQSKVHYLPNGIDLQWFDHHAASELPADLERFFTAHSGQFIAAYTGAIGMANGLDTLLDAAACLQQQQDMMVHLLLVGDGPEKERLQRRAREMGLQNLTFWPRVERSLVPAILQRCSCCLFHLRRTDVFKYGISSNKLFDYLASGRPMISALSGSFDFAEAARCGPSVPAEDPQALAGALLLLAGLPDYERQRLGQNARAYVEEHHAVGVLVDKLLKILHHYHSGQPAVVEAVSFEELGLPQRRSF